MKKVIPIIAVVLVGGFICSRFMTSNETRVFFVESTEENVIEISANNADKSASATGNIEIAEDEKFELSSQFETDKGVSVMFLKNTKDAEFLTETINGTETKYVETDPGSYTVTVIADDHATGHATVKAVKK